MLICFAGPKGSGKDTAAAPLLEVGFTRINLADELKWLAAEVFDFSPLSMESQEAKERLFDKPLVIAREHLEAMVAREHHNLVPWGFDREVMDDAVERFSEAYLGHEVPSLRYLLQWIGTAFRDQVYPEFWSGIWRDKVLAARAVPTPDTPHPTPPRPTGVVCTDLRYANERQAAREIGGVLIYVDRPGCGGNDTHASENDFGDPQEDYDETIVNSGPIELLHNRAATAAMKSGSTLWMRDLDSHVLDDLHLYFTGQPRSATVT